MLHKKNISSNYSNSKIGLAYVQFYKTKLHRGKKRHRVYELSTGSCHID